MDAVETVFDSYGLPAVCAVMLAKAAGIPVPIPGDLILLTTAARAAQGKLILWQAFALLLLAIVLGGTLQFGVARGPGRELVYRVGRVVGLGPNRLDTVAQAVRRGGLLRIALAILTPGVRTAAVPACGLAGLSLRSFLPPLILASALDLALHFVLGAIGGSLLGLVRPDSLAAVLGLVAVAVLGLAGWMQIVRRRRAPALPSAPAREAFAAWQQTACPACLVFGAWAPQEHRPAIGAAGTDVRL